APIVLALCGLTAAVSYEITARLDESVASRRGWTWFIPVALRHERSHIVAHPLPLRSSSVSLTARADGYLTMGEDDDEFETGTSVRISTFS
ncbi:MAG: hypothetical protein M3N13_02695, partial [Candidatus Eremiobacteraeota bacterium]|nr:hypothetical protein [Candidatus Eremiobacteraeota bacterium]